MKQEQLTILASSFSYPPRSGGAVHIFNAVRELSRYFQIRFYCLSQQPEAMFWGVMQDHCTELAAFRPQPRRALTLDPPAVGLEYSPDLVAHCERVWQQQAPAIVQLEFSSMAQYAPLARRYGAKVVCTAHNLAFLAQLRRTQAEQQPRRKLRRWLGVLSLWLYERRMLAMCDLVITHNQADKQALQRLLPALQVEYVPSGIDLARWQPNFDAHVEDRVLFVGNFQHPPNSEGALWLARRVWPLVIQERPQAQLILAGRGPTPEIQALSGPSIHVTGTLDEMRPLYAQASVFVAPIFWGSGIRIKLLEALAAGIPIVSTQLAAEGLDISHSVLLAEHAPDFAAAIVRLLNDRSLRERLGAAGPPVVQRDYDWLQLGARLAALYQRMKLNVEG